MDFHPEYPYDTNGGENVVWDALRSALEADEGAVFYRYPVTDARGFVRFEPDILLHLPRRVPLILECKGCRIEHIAAVEGGTWQMSDTWHRAQEAPLNQARNQAIGLNEMLQSHGVGPTHVLSLVALPFVAREEWMGTFGFQATQRNVLFAEDFDPLSLRARLHDALALTSIDGGTSNRIAAVLGARHRIPSEPRPADGAAATPLGATRPISMLRYRGAPPDAATLRRILSLSEDTPHTYLVATSALERQRREEGFGGQHQLKKELRRDAARPEEMQLLFHKALRLFIGQPLLGRSEERLLIQRAIREVAGADTTVRDQLRQDVFAWRDVLAELEEVGCDLAPDAAADAIAWAHPTLKEVARRLQAAYHRAQRDDASGRGTFERTAGHYVDALYQPTEIVVMEGFTRLTALQKRFIERCARADGIRLWIIQPFNSDQARGFASIASTYAPFIERATVEEIDTAPSGEPAALQALQTRLFTEAARLPAAPDRSVELRILAHRNDEVAACVADVIEALGTAERPGLAPRELAIVCSDPQGMAPLLLEQAELAGRPDLFTVPPRQLLLTPVGRFALTLYEVWTPQGLNLEPQQLATLLASGWLGGIAQKSVEVFHAVAAQQFERCRSEADWDTAFARIERLRVRGAAVLGSLGARLPALLVEDGQLAAWRDAVQTVVRLCRRLFLSGERPIGRHIQQLLDEIERLDPHRMFETEQEVLRGIREALAELTEARSVAVDAHEFGEVLSGLIHERQTDEGGDLPGTDPGARPQQVWVVGPEGIDNITRHSVWFLGLDDRRMPAAGAPPWPRLEWSIKAHIDLQRYRFLAVVRAARERLVLSYAQRDWEQDYRASPYLDEVQRVLSLTPQPPAPHAAAAVPPAAAASRATEKFRRDEYDVAHLAMYRLCPYRFKLESLTAWAGCYGTSWQLQWAARGAWLAEALHAVARTLPDGAEPKEIEHALYQAIDATGPHVRDCFSGIPELSWTTIEQAVRAKVPYIVYPSTTGAPVRGFLTAPPEAVSKEIAVGPARTVRINAAVDYQRRRGPYVNATTLVAEEALWLMSGKKAEEPSSEGDPDLALFGRLYDAVRWWKNAHFLVSKNTSLPIQQVNEFKDIILKLEQGRFPKNPGQHCNYCPAHDTCMGLNP